MELVTLIYLQSRITRPCNIVSDSAYVMGLFSAITTASLNANNPIIQNLLKQLKHILQKWSEPIFITPIRIQSGLLGPMTQGNNIAEKLVMDIFKTSYEEHAAFHTNTYHLHVNYYIPWRQARQIVDKCNIWAPLNKKHTCGWSKS